MVPWEKTLPSHRSKKNDHRRNLPGIPGNSGLSWSVLICPGLPWSVIHVHHQGPGSTNMGTRPPSLTMSITSQTMSITSPSLSTTKSAYLIFFVNALNGVRVNFLAGCKKFQKNVYMYHFTLRGVPPPKKNGKMREFWKKKGGGSTRIPLPFLLFLTWETPQQNKP